MIVIKTKGGEVFVDSYFKDEQTGDLVGEKTSKGGRKAKVRVLAGTYSSIETWEDKE